MSATPLDPLRIDPAHRRHARRTWPWWAGALAVLAIGTGVLVSGRPLAVETARVRAADGSGPVSVLDASGYVTARRIATVSSQVAGRVDAVLIEEGMRVEEGQLLARLDAADARAQHALATAQLAAAQAQLGDARAQAGLAEANLGRQQDLARRGLAAAAVIDQAVAERDSIRARLAALQRQVDVAREQQALAELAVTHTEIRAPFAGVVVAKAAQPGEVISPISAGGGFTRTGIGTIVDMDSLEVQVDVNEANIGRVSPGQPVAAVLNAYPDWSIPGRVLAIVPTADRSRATVRVRIALDARDPRILPDMGIRVAFLAQAPADAGSGFLVPTRALVGDGAQAAVFVIDGDVARRVPVQAFDTIDAERRVHGALVDGASVILSPPRELSDGRRVRGR